jgi:hypothetical protein
LACFNAQLYSGSNKGRAGSQKIAKEGKGKESRCGFLRMNGITPSHMLLSRKNCIVEFPYLQSPGCNEKMSGGEEEKEGPDGPSLRMVLISDTHSQHDDLPKPFPKGRLNSWDDKKRAVFGAGTGTCTLTYRRRTLIKRYGYAVLSIRDVYPGSNNAPKEEREKIFCHTIFCSHKLLYHKIVNNFCTGKENFFSQNRENTNI